MKDKIAFLQAQTKEMNAEALLAYVATYFGNKIALSNSMGAEDQVITDMLCKQKTGTAIFTLDTGRTFSETYELIDKTNKRYGINIQFYCPNAKEVEAMVNQKGIFSFYESVENRKECCQIRKIGPLRRAFAPLEAWICGLRREQSVTRQNVQAIEWDDNNQLIKINPLVDWTEEEVWHYIKAHKVPYNSLHDKGYPSIGCQPCTRAITKGEDVRAGRWWWENPDTKECGLHAR